MADPVDPGFPTSHTTTTTSQHTTTGGSGGGSSNIGFDRGYFKSIPGILRLVQIVVGFLYWVVLVSYGCYFNGVGRANFVGVSCWVFTVIFYIIFILGVQRKITVINWVFTELINNAVWCFFHLIAAIVVSVAAGNKWTCPVGGDGKLDFAAIAGWALAILYGASIFFNVRDFQAMGGMSSVRFGSSMTAMTTTTTTTTTTQQSTVVTSNEEKMDPPPPYLYP